MLQSIMYIAQIFPVIELIFYFQYHNYTAIISSFLPISVIHIVKRLEQLVLFIYLFFYSCYKNLHAPKAHLFFQEKSDVISP